MSQSHIDYHNTRERAEREAAARAASRLARQRHIELAELHACKAAEWLDAAAGAPAFAVA